MCESGFNYGDSSGLYWTFDQFFFRSTYVEFDLANNRFGFAPKVPKKSCPNLSP